MWCREIRFASISWDFPAASPILSQLFTWLINTLTQSKHLFPNVFGMMKTDRIFHPHSFPRETGVLYVDRRPRVLV
jgi:hypothetical protein